MLNRFLVFTMISLIGGTVVNAQTAPRDGVEKRVQRFVMAAPFERSYLGVQTVEISKENFAKFGLAEVRGVGVEKVVEDSPAAKAGLQNGDVVVRFDGEEIKSVSKLIRLIAEVAPDQTAKIIVLRGGGEREFNVTLGRRDESPFMSGNFNFENLPLPRMRQLPQMSQTLPIPPARGGENILVFRGSANRQIGVGVTPLTKQLSDYFGVAEGRGVLVNNVRENSPADKSGLKAGDVIVEVEGREVKGLPDLMRVINDKKEGDLSLTFIRDKNRQTVSVTPEISKDGAANFEEFDRIFEAVPNQQNLQMPLRQLAPPSPVKPAPPIL